VTHVHDATAARRLVVLLAAVLLTMLTLAPPAMAHGGEQSDEASVLVRQAIALIVSSPDDLGEIREKVEAAREAPDTTGVDLALVEQADAALTDGEDLAQVRALLERSIGAGAVTAPAPDEPEPGSATTPAATEGAGEPTGDMATGAEPGTTVIAEPLETRPRLDATDWLVLAGSILAGLAGVWLSLQYRPAREVTR